MRSYDQLFRYGGEEFLILFSDTEPSVAEKVLDRLRDHLADAPVVTDAGLELDITASFGAAPLTSAETVEQVIKRADAALYAAKNSGRNKVIMGS